MGAPSCLNNGKGSRNRVRDLKNFRERHDDIDWSVRSCPEPKPAKVKGGKKIYSYGNLSK